CCLVSCCEQQKVDRYFDRSPALVYNNGGLILLMQTGRPTDMRTTASRHSGGAQPCGSHSRLHLYGSIRRMAMWVAPASLGVNGTSSPAHTLWLVPSGLPMTH